VKRTEKTDPCIVNENFDVAELIARLIDHSLDVFGAGDIRNDGQSFYAFLAECCGGALNLIAAPGANGHGGTHAAQARSDGPANAAAGARDQSRLFRDQRAS
jgi:hypothetical protein